MNFFAWIRKDTQETILRLRNGKCIFRRDKNKNRHQGQARNRQLEHLDSCDLKRSFAAGNKRNAKAHSRYITLFKLRNHALASEKKNHRKIATTTDKSYKEYYRAMYPTPNCHFCKKQNIDVVEDTRHHIDCENRPWREKKKEELWDNVYSLIRANQADASPPAELLCPFAFSSKKSLDSHALARTGREWRSAKQLQAVGSFAVGAAELGLIPKALRPALRELGVLADKLDETADSIAEMVQCAIVADYRERCKTIAEDRDQKKLYRKHVLGQPE